jgi:hypothetical protein
MVSRKVVAACATTLCMGEGSDPAVARPPVPSSMIAAARVAIRRKVRRAFR